MDGAGPRRRAASHGAFASAEAAAPISDVVAPQVGSGPPPPHDALVSVTRSVEQEMTQRVRKPNRQADSEADA